MAVRQRRAPAYRGRTGSDPFTDLLFNTLIGFVLLFFIAIIFLNPSEDTGKIDIDAEYVITVTWPDNSKDDIDTWIEDPNGNVTWYRNRNAGLVHLDRDDRGMLNDTLVVSGKTIENPLNQEVTAIRGKVPGEYTVNIHYYESESNESVPVSVRIAKVNPVYEIAYYGVHTLAEKGAEKTAARFTLTNSGSVIDVNQLPKSLVTR